MIIEKVQYEIDWSEFKRGSSFFIPCLDTVQAKRTILEVTKRLKYKVLFKVVIEDGIRGLRVWKL
jgi:tRNA A37 threonylcarbamoyladenosine dehydratase